MTLSDSGARAVAQYFANHLLTLAEVATVTDKHPDTVKDRRAAGRWPNAVQDTTGRKTWRVPVTALVAAGDLEPAQVVEVESTLAAARESKQVAALREEIATLRADLSATKARAAERARTIESSSPLSARGGWHERPPREPPPDHRGHLGGSLPKALGGTARQYYTFKTRTEAEGWLVLADAFRRTGAQLPEPPEVALVRPNRPARTEFASVAREWHAETYLEDFRGDAGRADDVLRDITRIDTYLTRHGLHLETFTRDHERRLYRWLLTGDQPAEMTLPEGYAAGDLVTRAEALAVPGMASRSTFKTRIREGVIPPQRPARSSSSGSATCTTRARTSSTREPVTRPP